MDCLQLCGLNKYDCANFEECENITLQKIKKDIAEKRLINLIS